MLHSTRLPVRRDLAPALCCTLLWACNAGASDRRAETAPTAEEEAAPGPAGESCRARRDCPRSQICLEGTCRYQLTSTSGEILAAAAHAQLETGDVPGAVSTYAQAMDAYAAVDAPVPPKLACGAATAALRLASEPDSRETAASYADRCFRSSLPGDRSRIEVQRALARLRFDGLDLALFDREQPATRFFTQPQTRPTSDAIEIALDLPDRDHAGYTTVSESLRNEQARQAIAECFIADWELHHRRSADASLVLKFDTSRRDMGDYDVFVSNVKIDGTSGEENGFEPCVAGALVAALEPGPRMPYPVRAWQEPFAVAARLQ